MRSSKGHRVSSLAGILSILGMLAAGGAALADDDPPRTISVTGRGQVSVEPDTAVVSVAIETTGKTAGDATRGNAESSRGVIQAVKKKLDADRDQLKTTGYSLQPRYADRRPGAQGPPSIVGYVARNEVRVTVHDLDRVGEVLDAALSAGANRTSGLRFLVEERDPHVREALSVAGREARAQAESIAAALGVSLGEVLSASTTRPSAPARMDAPYAAMAMRGEASMAPPVEAGEIEIQATLHVTYGIR